MNMNLKHTFASFALAFLALLATSPANAQAGLKIGYTNVSYILSMMPESKQIEKELQTYSAQLEKELQTKIQSYQEKMESYQRLSSTMDETIKADKEREILALEDQIQKFQEDAEVSMQKKQAKLLEPVTKKISDAISRIAKANNYTYVFNSDAGFGTTQILLHAPDNDNVTDLVLKELGIELPANSAAGSE